MQVRISARNVYVRLDERLEHEYSPIRHTDRIRCPVTVAWAEKESAEFARQSREFAEKLRVPGRSEEHTSELQSRLHLVCRLLLEKKKKLIQVHRLCD